MFSSSNSMRWPTMARVSGVWTNRCRNYRQSGGKGKNADVQAAKLVVRGSICERVAELKEAQSRKSELSRDRLREFLTEVILTPAGKVDEQSRLCHPTRLRRSFVKFECPTSLLRLRNWQNSAAGTNRLISEAAMMN